MRNRLALRHASHLPRNDQLLRGLLPRRRRRLRRPRDLRGRNRTRRAGRARPLGHADLVSTPFIPIHGPQENSIAQS